MKRLWGCPQLNARVVVPGCGAQLLDEELAQQLEADSDGLEDDEDDDAFMREFRAKRLQGDVSRAGPLFLSLYLKLLAYCTSQS